MDLVPIDPERLAQIILEEVKRALGAGGATMVDAVSAPASPVTAAPVGPTGSCDCVGANKAKSAPSDRPSDAPSDSADRAVALSQSPSLVINDPEEIIRRPLLVLFSRTNEDIEPVCEQLDAIRKAGYAFCLCDCENFRKNHDTGALAARFDAPRLESLDSAAVARIVARLRLIVWATVSPNTTRLLVNGMTETLPSRFLHQALKTRLPVLAAAPAGWQDGPRFMASDPERRLYLGELASLRAHGLEVSPVAALSDRARAILAAGSPDTDRKLPEGRSALRRTLVTLHDVEDLLKSGQTVVSAPGPVMLTDLAREFMRAHQMTVAGEID